jgi:hypothetical protein
MAIMGGRLWIGLAVLLLVAGGYVFGLYSYQRDLWPIGLIRNTLHLANISPLHAGTYVRFLRLASYPGKIATPCPPPAADTAVILVLGQSNAANHGSERFTSQQGSSVLNLFEGKCYRAASPLLGATGEVGEFLTPMADKLIGDGLYKRVVLVPAAVGGTTISRWGVGGDLNEMVGTVIAGLPEGYKLTQVVWVQGEDDWIELTPPEAYTRSFASLLGTLPEVPVFIAIATRCTGIWRADNAIAQAQRRLIDNRRVFLGGDMDGLLSDADRRPDQCHWLKSAQVKAANAFATAIERAKNGR